jgi:type I restriction enzyme S subunit
MERYTKYKDSGIAWLGEIPEHWEIVPMTKYLESIIDYRGRTPNKIDSGLFLVTAKNIKNGIIDYSLSEEYVDRLDAQSLLNRGIPQIGDVLFTTEAPLGEVANIDKEDIALAQRVIKFRGKKNIVDNYFLKYWIMCDSFQQDLYTYATGSTALGIKASKLSKLLLLLSPIKEQKLIAAFLDRKTAEIDELIAQKQRLIALYEEEKTAIINEAVTKGINPDVKLNGDIPEHWEVTRMANFGEFSKGKGINKSQITVSGLPALLYGDIYTKYDVKTYELMRRIDEETASNSIKCFSNDLLFTGSGETPEDIGKCLL